MCTAARLRDPRTESRSRRRRRTSSSTSSSSPSVSSSCESVSSSVAHFAKSVDSSDSSCACSRHGARTCASRVREIDADATSAESTELAMFHTPLRNHRCTDDKLNYPKHPPPPQPPTATATIGSSVNGLRCSMRPDEQWHGKVWRKRASAYWRRDTNASIKARCALGSVASAERAFSFESTT